MSNSLRFGDHTAFHLQVLRLSLVGAGLGLLTFLVSLILPALRGAEPAMFLAPLAKGAVGHAVGALWLTVIAAAVGLAAAPPTRKTAITAGLLALGVGLLGALSYQALANSSPRYMWFGIFVLGAATGIIASRDLRDRRRFLVPLAMGATLMLAKYVVFSFGARLGFVSHVPSFVAETAYGAIFGFMVSVALVARQIRLERDPVAQAFQEIKPSLKGEMLELCQRAVTLYARVKEVLGDRQLQNGEMIRGAENLVLRIFGLARKWHEVEREAGRTSAADLAGRIEGLDGKIKNTSDSVARKQYKMAREALNTQLRYLRDISRSGERVTAQVYNYLAALERLHLAVLNHQGADAAKLSDEIQPILDDIDTIGCEMDFESDAISEVAEVANGDHEEGEKEGLNTEPTEPTEDSEGDEAEPAPEAEGLNTEPTEPTEDSEGDEPVPEAEAETEAEAESADDPETRLNARLYE